MGNPMEGWTGCARSEVTFTPKHTTLSWVVVFRGVLKWPDGRIYTGSFKNGFEDG